MASSIKPVPAIWQSAPSNSHGKNTAVGHGTRSPVPTSTIAKNTIENGKPNRNRILVAPQVPSGPVNCRCIALRATCPSAAVMVKGIQSVAILNMGAAVFTLPWRGRVRIKIVLDYSHPLRHHHVIHVHVGGEAPAVGERAVDHAGLFGDAKLVVLQMMGEFVRGNELVPVSY